MQARAAKNNALKALKNFTDIEETFDEEFLNVYRIIHKMHLKDTRMTFLNNTNDRLNTVIVKS